MGRSQFPACYLGRGTLPPRRQPWGLGRPSPAQPSPRGRVRWVPYLARLALPGVHLPCSIQWPSLAQPSGSASRQPPTVPARYGHPPGGRRQQQQQHHHQRHQQTTPGHHCCQHRPSPTSRPLPLPGLPTTAPTITHHPSPVTHLPPSTLHHHHYHHSQRHLVPGLHWALACPCPPTPGHRPAPPPGSLTSALLSLSHPFFLPPTPLSSSPCLRRARTSLCCHQLPSQPPAESTSTASPRFHPDPTAGTTSLRATSTQSTTLSFTSTQASVSISSTPQPSRWRPGFLPRPPPPRRSPGSSHSATQRDDHGSATTTDITTDAARPPTSANTCDGRCTSTPAACRMVPITRYGHQSSAWRHDNGTLSD